MLAYVNVSNRNQIVYSKGLQDLVKCIKKFDNKIPSILY